MSFTDLEKYEERFLAKTNKTKGCWLWIGATGSNGYGQMQVGPRKQQAHRFAYELYVGKIPENLTIDHICRRINCVNPYHLRPMTMAENSRIGNRFTARTACHLGHLYSPENTTLYRGYRICKTCKSAKDRKQRLKHLERYNERHRLHYVKNKEMTLAKQRERYARNREMILAQQKEYRTAKSKGE